MLILRDSPRAGTVPRLPALGRSGALELGDLDLAHLQHRRHHALRLLLVRIADQLAQDLGNDLPGDAVLVLEPTARALLAPFGELAPVRVDLLLVLAVDLERDGLVRLEVGAAVQRREALSVELEDNGHDRALVPRTRGAVTRDLHDPGAREDRRVQLRRLFALGVEPETGSDLLHRKSFPHRFTSIRRPQA